MQNSHYTMYIATLLKLIIHFKEGLKMVASMSGNVKNKICSTISKHKFYIYIYTKAGYKSIS
jgi:hypothetical protein